MKKPKTLGMGMKDLLRLTLDKDLLPAEGEIKAKEKEIQALKEKIEDLQKTVDEQSRQITQNGKLTKNEVPVSPKSRGKVKSAEKKPISGLAEIKKESAQQDTEAIYKQAVTLLKQNKLSQALEKFGVVLYFQPDHIKSLNNMGVIFYEMGLDEFAVEKFKRILKLDPKNKTASENLALIGETDPK